MEQHSKIPAHGNKILIGILGIVIMILWFWCCRAEPITTIFISRHAEKLNNTPDTPLSPAGLERAGNLAHVLKDAEIEIVFVTEFLRTRQTAEPTAVAAGVNIVQYRAGNPQGVVDTILADHIGKTILIIGHSNTVDDLAAGFGANNVLESTESQFDRLFMVHRIGSTTHLQRLRYGDETP